MLTKKDFEVTDPKEIFSVDIIAANKALQENFADRLTKQVFMTLTQQEYFYLNLLNMYFIQFFYK